MKKYTAIALVAAALLIAGLAGTSQAQYYGYWYNYAPGYDVPAPRPSAPATSSNPLLYRMVPDPLVFRRWDNQIRIWDFLELQRSPLNQETTLEYMMRTF
jgi:hypothetical protein